MFAANAIAGVSSLFSLDFTGGSLPAGATLTRASSGTRVNSSGTLVTETTDVARFDYHPVTHAALGILVEASATNIVLNSDDLSSANIYEASYSLNATTGPDGTNTADKLVESVNASNHVSYQYYSVSTGTWTVSAELKPAGRNYAAVQIGLNNALDRFTAVIDLTTGTVTATQSAGTPTGTAARVEVAANGFYRLLVTGSQTVATNLTVAIYPSDSGTPTYNAYAEPTYTGDGTSGIYVAGVQMEQGNGSSVIPTTGTSATRAADSLGFTIPAGIGHLTYTFDDNSTQTVAVSPGAYTVPTNLNRADIKTIVGAA